MREENIIEGQISIFDILNQDNMKPKDKNIKSEDKKSMMKAKIKDSNLDEIVYLYSENCSRIVKTFSGALLVELDDKTLYFNSHGIYEFSLPLNVGIMPGEEILIDNNDKEITSIQKQKIKELKITEYIKRKGDSNIIIPGEKTTVINPKGWILEYLQEAKFHENEVVKLNVREEKISRSDIYYQVGDKVYIKYNGIKSIGNVVRIYNNGETLNVSWDGKETAFYYKNVEKLD